MLKNEFVRGGLIFCWRKLLPKYISIYGEIENNLLNQTLKTPKMIQKRRIGSLETVNFTCYDIVEKT